MTEFNLSSDARRRLWQCYSLLLRLAEEGERDTAADPELVEGHESAAATEANELTRPDHVTPEAWSEQMEPGSHSQLQIRGEEPLCIDARAGKEEEKRTQVPDISIALETS